MKGVNSKKNLNFDVLDRLSVKITREEVMKRVGRYGFIECGEILTFLSYACSSEILDIHALRYVYGKTAECLANHPASDIDNQECYFQDLFVLKGEIEFIISLYF